MSKAVRWQVKFATNDIQSPKKYCIDIYDEQDGSWSGTTQLQAGDVPFITDEDDSEDYFAPIRPQTGKIEICTLLPGTTDQYITLEELLPDNNIARPVKVRDITNPSHLFSNVVWQGFLSCEAYSQDYVGIPRNLQLPVISVLEAMDSVQLDQTRSSGMSSVRFAIYNALNELNIQSGMSFYTHINYSMTSWRILGKRIDQTVFYDIKEYNNENDTNYIISGISAQEAIKRLCTFMGWVAREQGTEIYFEYVSEPLGMYREKFSDFGGSIRPSDPQYARILQTEMEELDWMGTDHKQTVKQGAKSVEVVAKLEKYKLNISLPAFPVGDIQTIYRRLWKYEGDGDWMYLVASLNANAYSNIQFAYYTANIRYAYFHFEGYGTTTLANVLEHMSVGDYSSARVEILGSSDMTRWYAGAFLSRYCWEDSGSRPTHDTQDALYCVFFPRSLNYTDHPDQYEQTDFDPSHAGAIFSINNVTEYRCNLGYLCLTADTDTVFIWPSEDYTGADLKHSDAQENDWYIGLELQFGNKWWNGSSWQSSWCTFKATMRKNGFKNNWNAFMRIKETDGHLIPVNENLHGLITFKIWPMASPTSYSEANTQVLEMMFKSIRMEHIIPDNSELTSRGENHYIRLLGTNFRDHISISSEISSFMSNMPSPSLVMNTETNPMETMDYDVEEGGSIVQETRRPEVDLLNRMADFYSKARRRVDLVAKHPTSPLPLIQMDGIEDSKQYIPLCESRDWQTEVCTITCFETPQEPPSES